MRTMIGASLLLATICWAGTANAGDCSKLKLCFKDSTYNGKGKPIKWNMISCAIKFYVNVEVLPQASQQKAIDAVKAAFAAYEFPCSELKFQYAGTETAYSGKKGGLLIAFGDATKDSGSWISGNAPYWTSLIFTSYDVGEIGGGTISLNAGDYGWVHGGAAVSQTPSGKKYAWFDIKTVLWMLLPDMLGFSVDDDFAKQGIPIAYETVLKAPCAKHKEGALFSYFKSGGSCKQPTKPAACTAPKDAPDLGVLPDGFFKDMGKQDCGKVSPGLDGGSTTTDGSAPPTKCSKQGDCAADEICSIDGLCVKKDGGETDDDGCCRVGHARDAGWPLLLLLGVGAALMYFRRRFRG